MTAVPTRVHGSNPVAVLLAAATRTGVASAIGAHTSAAHQTVPMCSTSTYGVFVVSVALPPDERVTPQ